MAPGAVELEATAAATTAVEWAEDEIEDEGEEDSEKKKSKKKAKQRGRVLEFNEDLNAVVARRKRKPGRERNAFYDPDEMNE